MHIKKAVIYGFGKWVDHTIDFTDESFVCMYGNNESGKTTVQQFLLFMLFGMPPQKRAGYKPKTSGKMGGRLTVHDADIGAFVIERLHDVSNGKAICYTSDGKEHDESWLQKQLKGMTKEIYQSIFSFSALDLLDIRNMHEEELGEVLLGIGMTGSNQIHTLEKKLDDQLNKLFKPFGKKPEINQQLASLDTLDHALKHYQKNEQDYRTSKESLHQLDNELILQQRRLDETRDAVFRLNQQRQALPILKDYHRLKNQHQTFPDGFSFPEDGIKRMEQVDEKLLPLKSECSVLQNNKDAYVTKRNDLQNDLYDETVYEQLAAFLEEKQTWLDRQKQIDEYAKTIQKSTWQINEELKQLDAGITMDDLSWLQLPFSAEKTWNQLKNEWDQVELTKATLNEEHRQLLKEQEYLHVQKETLQASLMTTEQEYDLQETVRQYYRQKQIQDDVTEQAKNWYQLKNRQKSQTNIWVIGGIVASALISIVALAIDRMLLLSAAGVILVASVGQWVLGKRSVLELDEMIASTNTDSISVTEEEKQEAEQLLKSNDDNKQEWSILQDKWRSNDMAFWKWEEKQSEWNHRNNRLQKQVAEQIRQYPFLKQIDLSHWPALFHSVKHVLDEQRHKKWQEQQCEELLQENRRYEEMIDQFFHDSEWITTNRSTMDQLTEMENILHEYRKSLSLIDQYNEWIADTEAKKNNIQEHMRLYEDELAHLLSIAGTDTKETFLAKGKQLQEKQECAMKIAELDDRLVQLLSGDDYETLIVNEPPDERALESAYERETDRISDIEHFMEQKRQERADVKAYLASLESSESYSDTLHRYTAEQEKFENMAEEWAVLKSAKAMLADTKRHYRQTYLQQVMEKTTHFFHLLTETSYCRIYPPEENKSFRVESCDGIRYDVHELSQGTIDQLYVSLRLGISDVMSREHRLPFIIDDAFVHFDPVRTKRIAELLSSVSNKQQVILFTCKPNVTEATANVTTIHGRIPLV
ncbi:AAA family ATPase [Lentibacillus halophilus]|uniref:AAA family ATPase n=1 Tax=Lentibacillus halophilus TaxID=295065 RepID=A0ABN0Z8D2_9BACI